MITIYQVKCLLSVYSLFTLCFNSLITLCLLYVYSLFSLCLLSAYALHTFCLLSAYSLITLCLLFIYSLFTLFIISVYSLFTHLCFRSSLSSDHGSNLSADDLIINEIFPAKVDFKNKMFFFFIYLELCETARLPTKNESEGIFLCLTGLEPCYCLKELEPSYCLKELGLCCKANVLSPYLFNLTVNT